MQLSLARGSSIIVNPLPIFSRINVHVEFLLDSDSTVLDSVWVTGSTVLAARIRIDREDSIPFNRGLCVSSARDGQVMTTTLVSGLRYNG